MSHGRPTDSIIEFLSMWRNQLKRNGMHDIRNGCKTFWLRMHVGHCSRLEFISKDVRNKPLSQQWKSIAGTLAVQWPTSSHSNWLDWDVIWSVGFDYHFVGLSSISTKTTKKRKRSKIFLVRKNCRGIKTRMNRINILELYSCFFVCEAKILISTENTFIWLSIGEEECCCECDVIILPHFLVPACTADMFSYCPDDDANDFLASKLCLMREFYEKLSVQNCSGTECFCATLTVYGFASCQRTRSQEQNQGETYVTIRF